MNDFLKNNLWMERVFDEFEGRCCSREDCENLDAVAFLDSVTASGTDTPVTAELREDLLVELWRVQLSAASKFGANVSESTLRARFPKFQAAFDRLRESLRVTRGASGVSHVRQAFLRNLGQPPEVAGAHLGAFELVEHLGTGGMGTVWKAHQATPVRRDVALKLIRAGLGDPLLLSRFQAERQALAVMSHPNIARMLEAHQSESGQPYLVMELVSGPPITRFAAQAKLSVRERVSLFVPICHAIQHAHQKGIIHRDLKPSNILVATDEKIPTPKVIDFGLVKATERPLADESLHTFSGQLVGTPDYMSPEQTRSGEMDLDTRTDIYSLGAVLYELLTGCRPLGDLHLSDLPIDVALAAIRDKDPVVPSQRVQAQVTSATKPPHELTEMTNPRELQGDLDWIVMKALDKDRSRRYPTAAALAADLERYLHGESVEAAPPSTLYRTKKYIRKNRGFVAATSATMAILLIGIFGTSWGMWRALDAEKKTESRRLEAEKNLSYAQKTVVALQSVLKQATPSTVGTTAQQAAEISLQLENFLNELAGEADADHRELAKIRRLIGEILMDLGEAEKAIPILEAGVTDCRNEYGHDHSTTIDTLTYLGRAFLLSNRIPEAIRTCKQVFELQSQKHGVFSDQAFQARNTLNNYYMYLDPSFSAHQATETLELATRFFEPDDFVMIRSLAVLQSACRESFQFEKAIELGCQLVELTRERSEPSSLLHLASGPRNSLAATFTESGQFKLGQELFEECYAFRVEYYGSHHPYSLHTLGWLGRSYYFDGQIGVALPILEKRYEQSLAQMGPNASSTLEGKSNLGAAYRESGNLELSQRLLEETRDARISQFGLLHRDSMWTSIELAKTYAALGQYQKSLELFEFTTFLMEQSLGQDDPDFLDATSGMALVYLKLGNLQVAEDLLERSLQGLERLNYFHRVAYPIVESALEIYGASGRLHASVELLDGWQVARSGHQRLVESSRGWKGIGAIGR